MKDPAICVKDIIVGAPPLGTFGATTGWGVYIGALPALPDTVIVVNRTGGRPPYPHLLLNEPSVQVTVRGAKNGYVDAGNKIQAIVNRLLGMTTQVLQGDTYRSCNQIGDVAYLGQDDNTRPILVANFWFIVEPAAEAGGNRVAIT
jgi:hypothetical protein